MNISKKRVVTLTITNHCNLKCIYCYEHNKSLIEMKFETAKKIIDCEFQINSSGIIEFDFFGGEPFSNFKLIKEIDEYLVNNYSNNKWILFASTNGTLINDEIKEWLKKRPYFYCGLSLDGSKKMHDMNRNNSFDSIDIDFFKEQYPSQPIKMTISNLSLKYLSEGVIFLHKKGFVVECNLAYGINWSNIENKGILSQELKKLIDFYLENPKITPCRLLRYNIENVLSTEDEFPKKILKWCGAGNKMHTYYIDGKRYPCQFFMPLSIDDKKANLSNDIKFNSSIPIELLDIKCQKCPFVSSCPTCYGYNYSAFNNIYTKDDNICELTRIIFIANSYFQAKKWELNQIDCSTKKGKRILRGIKIIQDYMKETGDNV